MSTIAIIGDVHGALSPLKALVEKLGLAQADHLIFVGDLVDKGPEPAGVVRFVRELYEAAPFRVSLVEGNHEDRHRRYYINKTARPAVAAAMGLAAPELPALDAALGGADRAFLAAAVPFVRVPDWNVLVVHGGIPGTMTAFPDNVDAASTLRGKARSAFRQILRTRYLSADGHSFRSYGEEGAHDPFWAEVYDGRFGHVVFGHQPFIEGPACFAHATGVDTACIHGGALTALVLPSGGANPHFVAVPGLSVKSYNASKAPAFPGHVLALARAG